MAYNPFNVFRRNQKTLFAIVTIVIMIVFTLQFGAGDLFQRIPNWIGNRRDKGEPAAVVNGSKIYTSDLEQTNQQRAIASEFMVASLDVAVRKLETTLRDGVANVSKEGRAAFLNLLSARGGQLPYLPPQILGMLMQNPQLQGQLPQFMQMQMGQFRNDFQGIATKPDVSKEEAELAKAAMSIISLDEKKIFLTNRGYFNHKAVNDDAMLKSALDFDLWKAEADKLGIKYTEAEAQEMYLDELYRVTDPKMLADMEKALFSSRTGYSREMIFKQLADEFRVRTAQSVLLGRLNAPQFFGTPWESYEFYRKQTNGGTYAVLTVPSENFLAKVTGAPNDNELRALFDKYRNREADPSKDNLGLREPRKLKIGWLEATGNEPYFKKLGADALANGEVHARAAVLTTIPLPGGGFETFAAPLMFTMQDPALADSYDKLKKNQDADFKSWHDVFIASTATPLTRSSLKPNEIAATAAMAAGSAVTHAGFLPPVLTFIEKGRWDDRTVRTKAIAAALTIPGLGAPFGPGLNVLASLPPALPLSVFREELLQKVKSSAVLDAASMDLTHFGTEVAKLKEPEAKEAIAKFVRERGLVTGESKSFDSQWTMSNDTGLQPLMDKMAKEMAKRLPPDTPLFFGPQFFVERDGLSQRFKEATKLFVPQPFPDSPSVTITEGEPVFMTWRTAEEAAVSPRDFDQAKPKVLALWRSIEARKLAAKAAEQMASEVKDMAKAEGLEKRADDYNAMPAVERIVNEVYLKSQGQYPTFAEKDKAVRFQIRDVAPISMSEEDRFTPQQQPQPFMLRPRKAMPYPTFAMQQALLDNKDGPPATTLVLAPDSKDDYYVCVLIHRQRRDANQFYTQVFNEAGPLRNDIRGMLTSDEKTELDKQTLALLREEFKVEILSDKLK